MNEKRKPKQKEPKLDLAEDGRSFTLNQISLLLYFSSFTKEGREKRVETSQTISPYSLLNGKKGLSIDCSVP
jgi:hypothetical protein